MKAQIRTDYLAESEADAPLYFGVPIDSRLFVTLPSRASNDPACGDEMSSADEADAWARRAAAASGFGDAMTGLTTPLSGERGEAASSQQARVPVGVLLAAIRTLGVRLGFRLRHRA